MASLGTIALGNYDAGNSSDTSTNGSDPLLEVIASADDADYAYDNANNTHTGIAAFALDNMPGDFGTMNSVSINLRYGKDTHTGTNTWDSLAAQIVQSDGSTALTDNTTIVSGPITTTTATNSGATTLTNPDTTSGASIWNGAIVLIRFGITKSKGGDSDQERVYAAEVTGDYDVSSGTMIPLFMHCYNQMTT